MKVTLVGYLLTKGMYLVSLRLTSYPYQVEIPSFIASRRGEILQALSLVQFLPFKQTCQGADTESPLICLTETSANNSHLPSKSSTHVRRVKARVNMTNYHSNGSVFKLSSVFHSLRKAKEIARVYICGHVSLCVYVCVYTSEYLSR